MPAAGCAVKSWITPASASFPHAVAPPPGTISAAAIESTGTALQGTQPPKGSFKGTPSRSTSDRLAPLGPRPRRETPWVVGLAVMLSFRRNRLKSGDALSAPSGVSDTSSLKASLGTISTVKGTCERGSGSRVALTVNGSSDSTWAAAAGRMQANANARRGTTAGRDDDGFCNSGNLVGPLDILPALKAILFT